MNVKRVYDRVIANAHNDKVQHHLYSFFIAISLFFISVPFGILVTLFIGVFKEALDHIYFKRWSWGDLLADVFGIADALLIYYLITGNLF